MSLNPSLRGDAMLLVTAIIWGFAFVAQVSGMEHVGPFTFLAVRFLLAALALLPFWFWLERESIKPRMINDHHAVLIGCLMLLGSVLQQVGLLYTTAARAGFITTLYVLFVPIVGLFFRHKTHLYTWYGCFLAIIGLWFLGQVDTDEFYLGDLLQLACAFMWGCQVFYVGQVSGKMSAWRLAFIQFSVTGLACVPLALIFETPTWEGIQAASGALLYTALLSTTLGFTLQIFAQRNTCPSHAAIIMGLEGVFAAIGGWWLLQQSLTTTEIIGCSIIFIGSLVSQLRLFKNERKQQQMVEQNHV